MKQFMTIFLSLLLVFALAACGNGKEAKTEPKKPESKIEKLCRFNPDEGLRTIYEMDYNGQKIKTENQFKGDKLYSKTDIDGTPGTITILKGDYMYSLISATKTGIKMEAPESVRDALENSSGIAEAFKGYLKDVTVGTTEVDGQKYDSETVRIEKEDHYMEATYCFDGDELVYIISDADGEKTTLKYLAYDDKVDEGVFEIPSGYTITEQ